MRELTRDEAVLIGDELKRVLELKAFEAAVEVLKDDFTNRITTSQPHETDAREEAYRRLQVLGELILTMQSLASAAYAIKLQAQLDAEDAEDFDDNE